MGRRALLVAVLLSYSGAGWAISGSDGDWSWRDAGEDDGSPLSWVDLRARGASTLGLSASVDAVVISLPFDFPFYGTDYSEITVYRYGAIAPGSPKSGPGARTSGTCLSDSTLSDPLIAPLWSSYDLSRGGAVYYKIYDDAVIIEWDSVYVNATDTGSHEFGAILYATGEIGFTYSKTSTGNTATRAGNAGTTGVVSGSGDVVELGCESTYLNSSNDSIYLTPWGVRHFWGDLYLSTYQDGQVMGTAASDRLGYSVAAVQDIDGDDGAELLVGAPYNDDAASNAGAAYLFYGGDITGEVLAAYAELTVTGDAASDQLGAAVSGAGDVDGDGEEDILLGAPYNDRGASNGGAAALYLSGGLSGSLDLDDASALYTGGASSDYAGWAVSAAGDVDGDGYGDVLIGAPYQDSGGSSAGAAYLVLGGSTPADARLTAADAIWTGESGSDYAGSAVSAAGDVDGDGYGDVLIGAYGSDAGGSGSGAVYLAMGSASVGGTTPLSRVSRAAGAGSGDAAGVSVAAAGADLDEDGYGDLVVGAYTAGVASDGAAYLLYGSSSASLPSSLSSADGTLTGATADRLGRALAVLDPGDGGDPALVAGAYGSSVGASAAGIVYVADIEAVEGGSAAATTVARGRLISEDSSAFFGFALAAADFNGDGYEDVAVGAYGADGDYSASGVVHLITGRPIYPDADGDGHIPQEGGGLDCDDDDAGTGPASTETCDGQDNDCDGSVDEGSSDLDGDGIADCVDVEECDGIDNDGDGSVDEGQSDIDKDGLCDALDAETCDGIDNDGDGVADEDFSDADSDGIADCVDVEECDGIDNDGDGSFDEGFADTDADGVADCVDGENCDGIDNDGDGQVDEDFPDSDWDGIADCLDAEDCDGIDNDGDGTVDEGLADADGDGVCDALDAEDCDGVDNDGDGTVDEEFEDNDGDGIADCADGEDCDGVDNNGDGRVDEGYRDNDGDGTANCTDVEDCDGIDNDGNARVDEGFADSDYDGLPDCLDAEGCDGLDNDGDGSRDEEFPDADGDGAADCIEVEGCDGVDNDGDDEIDEGFLDRDGDGLADCVDPSVGQAASGGCSTRGARWPAGWSALLATGLGLIRRRVPR